MLFPRLAIALAVAALPAGPPAAPAGGAAAARDAPTPELTYAPEETMEFRVDFLGLRAGHARISVGRREGSIIPLFLEARTDGAGAIVDFRQHLATYVDTRTGLPRSSTMLSIEPYYRRTVSTRYDRDAGIATVRTQGRSDRTDQLEVPEGTLDFVALVFQLRSMPLVPGARHAFAVLSGTRLNDVVAQVEQRETVHTHLGPRAAVKVRVPTGFSGRFSEKNPTFVWFSDDADRVVLRIDSDFAIGSAVARLQSYRAGTTGRDRTAQP